MADSLLIEEAPPYLEDVGASVIVQPATADGGGGGGGGVGGAVGTLPAAAIQFADLTESGSESGDEVSAELEQQQQQESGSSGTGHNTPAARSSPPPNCAICLSRCRRKCFTDSCMHQFCFKCLCEWSKIKPECPLCKQPFKTIIHNVRTLDDYDRYPVQSSTPEHSAVSFHIVNIRRQRFMLQNQAVMTNEIDAAATDESQDGSVNAQPSRMHAPFNRFEPYRMELLNFYRHDQDAGGSGSLSQLWRRYVYDRKLYALPVSDSLTGHFREWSARFYRDNPAQMHRLMPWINRDIVCLLRNSPQNVSEVMQLMHEILPMINIPTRTFRRRLSPFLGERTNHFIHELFNFARSPYDMIGYDRVVQYSARVAEEVEVDLLDLVSTNEASAPAPADASGNANGSGSGNGNGSEANVSAESSSAEWSRLPRPSTSVIVTNPSATHSFSVTMATDGSELPGISIRRTTTSNVGSQTVAINLSMRRPANEVIEIDDGDAAANAEVAAINDGSNQTGRRQAGASLPITAHIELQSSDCSNSSDEDECVFVLERKPPHLRTPELVSLDSNSDSDVVFVDEQKPSTPPRAAAADGAEQAAKDAGAVTAAAAAAAAATGLPSELFMGPSTSTGVCSTSGKHWKTVLEEARRQDLMRLRSGLAKRNVTRAQQRRLPAAACSNSNSNSSSNATIWTDTSASSSSDDSYVEVRRRKRSRKVTTRKGAAGNKSKMRIKSKRPRTQMSETEEKSQQDLRVDSSSSNHSWNNSNNNNNNKSSSGSSSDASSEEAASSDSSDAAGNVERNAMSSSSSEDDSTLNMLLSTLRASLKAEQVGCEEKKPNKRKLKAEEVEVGAEAVANPNPNESQQQLEPEPDQQTELSAVANTESSAAKRRRSCSFSNSNSNSNLSSHNSNSVASTLASPCNTMSSSSALSLGLTSTDANGPLAQPLSVMQDVANSLIELSNVAGTVLFNDQSEQGLEDTISYLRNALPSAQRADDEDAQLGTYSDASNNDFVIDVVRDADESVDTNEINVHEQEREQEDEPDEEERKPENEDDSDDDEEDEEEEEEEDNDATDDAEESPIPDSEASDSD